MPPQMVDVGFDFHVWTRNQTSLQSALYDQGWEANFGGADYSIDAGTAVEDEAPGRWLGRSRQLFAQSLYPRAARDPTGFAPDR